MAAPPASSRGAAESGEAILVQREDRSPGDRPLPAAPRGRVPGDGRGVRALGEDASNLGTVPAHLWLLVVFVGNVPLEV